MQITKQEKGIMKALIEELEKTLDKNMAASEADRTVALVSRLLKGFLEETD